MAHERIPAPDHSGPSSEIKHQTLLLVDRRVDLKPVQQEEDSHRGVGHSFIAIDQRMVQCEGDTEG